MQVCMGIIRAIRNYPGDLSGAVCIRLLFRTPSLRPNGTQLSSPWWAILDISKVTTSCCCSYLTHWLCQHMLPCARSSHRSCGRFARKSFPNRAPLPECRVGDVTRRTRLWSGYVENKSPAAKVGKGGMVGRGGSSRLVHLAVVMGGRDATKKSPQGGQKFAPYSVMAKIPPSPLRILTGRLSHVSGQYYLEPVAYYNL